MTTRLKSGQREKLRNFILVTNSNEQIGIRCLQQSEWNLEFAIDTFYSQSFQDVPGNVDSRKLDAMFNAYANDPQDRKLMECNTDEPRIGPNGMLRLLSEINVDPTSVEALVLAWKLKAETQCEFSANEFRTGLRELRVDSVEKLRNLVPSWKRDLENRPTLRSLYHFTFNYAKSAATRHLGIETACAYWMLFFETREPRVRLWITFLEEQKTRAVSLDLWNMFFEFLTTTNDTYDDYDTVSSAWPVTIDEFVVYARKRQNDAP